MTALDLAREVRAAIESFHPEQAENAMGNLAKALADTSVAAEDRIAIIREFEAIRTLAAASCEGLARARQEIEGLLRISREFACYDKSGHMESNPVKTQKIMRF
ncbi:hypothetical protein RGQ15_00550 [Paracoccus sp. MBLB3053]|uniref:Uncharacterized protein n=1 Tax=Paracoccus aurantius TaxID=3073814 RepID=A0ABU2HM11_9RHOB|nr:hypothetical protein [Paracoccus sp. MBLB3053]MDS9466066.1 hypothetical protein [Paracoccus sp. MBLB3053]